MDHARPRSAIRILAVLAYIAMVAVNYLANALPLNNRATGEVSDNFPNLFAPAGLTFAIWGLIYLLLAGYVLFQLGLFQARHRSGSIGPDRLDRVSTLLVLSSLANLAWIFSWHYNLIPLSTIFMLIILCCLIMAATMLRPLHLTLREAFFVRLPFSIYFGWITVATIANITTLLVYVRWNRFGISEPVWTMIVLIVGALIGIATVMRNHDTAYGLVLVWAYFGIWLKHTSPTGFNGQYAGVIITTLACIGAFVIAIVYSWLENRKRTNKPERA